MDLLQLPQEIHAKIAGFTREERNHHLHGIVGSCRKLNLSYAAFLYQEPYLRIPNGSNTNLHLFAQTMEQSETLRNYVKELEVEVVGQGTWDTRPTWMETAQRAVSRLGPRFQHTLWSRWLELGTIEPTLGMVILGLPKLRKFVLTSDGQPNRMCGFTMYKDLSSTLVRSLLPNIQSIQSRGMFEPIHFEIPHPTHLEFGAYNLQPQHPRLKWNSIRNVGTLDEVESVILHLHVTLLTTVPSPIEYRLLVILRSVVRRCIQLRKVRIVVHNTGLFHRKPDFHPDMNAINTFFIEHAAPPLESMEVDVDQLSPEAVGRIRSFKSLSFFSGLWKLRAPQTALARIKRDQRSESRATQLLSSVQHLSITQATGDCHIIAVGILEQIASLPDLRTIEVVYINQNALEVDSAHAWGSLTHCGLRIARKSAE